MHSQNRMNIRFCRKEGVIEKSNEEVRICYDC